MAKCLENLKAKRRRRKRSLRRRKCDYMGRHFGATYIDGACIDGRLYDLDDCDDDGSLYGFGDEPCPRCNTREWLRRGKESVESGYSGYDGSASEWEYYVALALRESPATTKRVLRSFREVRCCMPPENEDDDFSEKVYSYR